MSQILELDPHSVIVGDRFRPAEKKAVEARAQSIMSLGQLQPIGVFEDNGSYRLSYGLHRLEACKLNGMKVKAVLSGQEDPILRMEMELAENVERSDMHWSEREQAIAKIHQMRMEREPAWTQQKTQELAELPRRADVADAIKLTSMMELFPELKEAKSKAQAMSWAKSKADLVMRKVDVASSDIDYGSIESRIILGDSVEVIKTIPNDSFHLVLTDPPFGIDFDSRKAGTEGSLTAYKDDEDSYRRLLSMAPDLYRVVKPGGFLIWFFGMSWYEEVKKTFRDVGFIVDELPVVWNRSNGRCHTNRPDRYFARGYDVALHCIKGENAQIVQRGKSNVFTFDPVPSSDRDLLVERPVELYAEFIRRLTVPGEVVADFFVGSGSCPAAAAQEGRAYFGVEQNSERRAVAIKKVYAYTPDKAKQSGDSQPIQPAVA